MFYISYLQGDVPSHIILCRNALDGIKQVVGIKCQFSNLYLDRGKSIFCTAKKLYKRLKLNNFYLKFFFSTFRGPITVSVTFDSKAPKFADISTGGGSVSSFLGGAFTGALLGGPGFNSTSPDNSSKS